MSTVRRRVWAGVAAVAMAAAAALMGAPAASADPLIPGSPSTGTLFVHKHQTPAGAPGNGLPLPVGSPGTPPIAGVGFTATQLNPAVYDLTTNAGWQALSQLTPATAPAAATGPATVLPLTDAAGLSTQVLPIGAYWVTETTTPAGVTAVAPFLVTLPMTDPVALNTWTYDVHVYPKNALVPAPVKTVDDSAAYGFGSPVVYTITSQIPDVNPDQDLDGYRVRDLLPAQLTYVSATAAFTGGTPTAPLVAGTHYTVTNAPTTAPAAPGTDVRVVFTPDGLALLEANSALSVAVTINTTVNAVTATGIIANAPLLYPNQASWGSDANPGPGFVGNTVETRWGSLQVTKVSAASATTLLPGAQFRIYGSEADARANNPALSISTGTPATSTFTTDANGVLTITGLRYSTWENGVTDPTPRQYWLVETIAPTGYELLADPIAITIDAPTVLQTVQNPPKNGGFQLPFTGATGAWLFPVGGALLLGGAGLLVAAKRRRATRAV